VVLHRDKATVCWYLIWVSCPSVEEFLHKIESLIPVPGFSHNEISKFEIRVRYGLIGRPRRQSRSIWVTCNGESHPSVHHLIGKVLVDCIDARSLSVCPESS
jgi:hypothetical protein